eukprot:ANDGO_03766.mRNA.1 hypothetical protein
MFVSVLFLLAALMNVIGGVTQVSSIRMIASPQTGKELMHVVSEGAVMLLVSWVQYLTFSLKDDQMVGSMTAWEFQKTFCRMCAVACVGFLAPRAVAYLRGWRPAAEEASSEWIGAVWGSIECVLFTIIGFFVPS